MGVERRAKKWVARLVVGDSRYLIGVFGSEEAARSALATQTAAVHDGTSPYLIPGACSIKAYAARRSVRAGTVKRWVSEGLPCHRVERVVLIEPEKADAWIAERYADSVAFNRESVVYLARRERDGAIKIGWSSDMRRRLGELEKLADGDVVLLAAVPGDKPDELRIHERFSDDRLDGEWYAPSPRVLAFVARLREAAA